MTWRRRPCIAVLAAAGLLGAGCAGPRPLPPPAQATAADQIAISVPFRNRWWHFHERGLAWADAGRDDLAEQDLRQVLRLRRTDARLARTYGMHFVQCFARRELAAILVRRGALDEAESLLRESLAQEPSAKAEQLLRTIADRRAGAAAPPAPLPAPPAARIEAAAAGDAVTGRVVAAAGATLWQVVPGSAPAPVPVAPDGAFAVAAATGALLVLGDRDGPDPERAVAVTAETPPPAPTLAIDGPDAEGRTSAAGAWYRWRAEAAAGLDRLRVHDGQGALLAEIAISGGDHAGGTLRVRPETGSQRLRFTVSDRTGATAAAERRVTVAGDPQQDRRLRAVALAIPLQAPRPGAMRPGDDARLMTALLDDGRFRLVDGRADGLLAAELALVEAGHVDRSTAAAAGRRLRSRYVIAGTMTRTAHDAECYLRLIHADSGRVVATADAFVATPGDAAAEALFAAAAGRLRQAFPVLSGAVTRADGGEVRFAAGSRDRAQALMRIHVLPPGGGASLATLELVEIGPEGARARVEIGRVPALAEGISE